MTQRFVILIFGLILSISASAQNFFWIGFTDKNDTQYLLETPGEYLSERAIERRVRQNIRIDSLDLPVNQWYIDSVLQTEVNYVHSSKWLNGVTVETSLEDLDFMKDWSFVGYIQKTKSPSTKSAFNKFIDESTFGKVLSVTPDYGESFRQVDMLNGLFLHERNYRGEGMQIAVLDAGFYKTDELPAFDSLWANGQILGTRDFVDPGSDIFTTDSHGMSVLSCMGGNIPGQLVGTAPDANYWLLRSEDNPTEYIIEEDNWVVAAEFADSVGADIINSSLGYATFDDDETSHTYADMDGKTTRVTRAANIAVTRGMLVFSSAGNERNNTWFRIVAPSDGDLVIGVAAVDKDLNVASFSSAGPASDGDVKPNVAAMGVQTTLQRPTNYIGVSNGTSFSSPVMAGMAACLWQMFPERTSLEIKVAIEKSASQYNSPDSLLGYGIPDMQQAATLLGYQSSKDIRSNRTWNVYPNPVTDYLVINTNIPASGKIVLEWISTDGILIKKWNKNYASKIVLNDIPEVGSGMYFLRVRSGNTTESIKISKQ